MNNIEIVARERGKIVARTSSHNIWLDAGREYLAKLLAYSSYAGPTAQENNRILYMGFGIGGYRQRSSTVLLPPYTTHYPGTNVATDFDTHLTRLERPVRVLSTGTFAPPTTSSDGLIYTDGAVFLKQVNGPPTHSTSTSAKYVCTFSEAEISYEDFGAVPLSEIGLFTSAANPAHYADSPVSYDTFEPTIKSGLITLEVSWTIRF